MDSGGREFEAAGLLEDLDDPRARAARLALLRDLEAEGVPMEELKEAVAQGRLAFLLVDRVLAGDTSYTTREIAERVGVEVEDLLAARQAMGLAGVDPDELA